MAENKTRGSTKNITKEQVYDLYVKQKLSTRECAKKLNIGRTTFSTLMSNYGIEARNWYWDKDKIEEILSEKLNIVENNSTTESQNCIWDSELMRTCFGA